MEHAAVGESDPTASFGRSAFCRDKSADGHFDKTWGRRMEDEGGSTVTGSVVSCDTPLQSPGSE